VPPADSERSSVGYQPVLEVTRGKVVESVHFGAVAVADASGRLVACWGDPETVTFLRSSAKPFQALPLLEGGAAERFGIPDRELAVACASHSGTDAHVETVASLQARVGVAETDLRCGTHPPYDRDTAQRLKRAGQDPTPNRHNCSGKHTGMLAQARFHGESLEGYVDPAHPVQRRILEAFAEMCAVEPQAVALAIDGCSVPTFAVPLRAAAAAYARLADPSGLGPTRAAACRRIFTAMTTHPDMIGGWDRFDTQLMLTKAGLILSKGGAEGYQGLALAPGAAGEGSPALGVTVKIADGDLGKRTDRPPGQRARSRVVAAVLQQLGVLAEIDLERLSAFLETGLTNWRGLVVGEMRPCLRLERSGP
jgi:L-asparaginase II